MRVRAFAAGPWATPRSASTFLIPSPSASSPAFTTAGHVLEELERLRIEKPPLAVPREVVRLGDVWVRPERLADVEHRGATADGLPRHPSFRGLLKDE